MKKFLKENWFKLTGLTIFFIVAFYTNYQLTTFKKFVQSYYGNKPAGLVEQSLCASQSEIFFKWYDSQPTSDFDTFTDHVNRQLGECFVLIQTFVPASKSASSSYDYALYDPFEKQQHADYWIEGNNLLGCSVFNNNCQTKSDFDKLIKPYMEN